MCYSTEFPGCGGRLRQSPADFAVEEVLSPEAASTITESGAYPVYLLTKEGIDTNHTLSGIFRKTGLRLRSLGLKDANAVTVQYVYASTRGEGLAGFETGKYSIRRLGYTKRPLSKRSMVGNRFRIRISDASPWPGSLDGGLRVLNFYGYQRFGSARPVTHLVGKALVQSRYRDAVDAIISLTSVHDTEENNRIRRDLADRSDPGLLLGRIPPRMDLERTVVSELARHGDDLRSIRALPVEMRRFYVQAYQSFLFNLTVSRASAAGENMFETRDGDVYYDDGGNLGRHTGDPAPGGPAIPVAGHSYYKKTRFHQYVSEVLAEEGVEHRDFYIRDLQEASSGGGFRSSTTAAEGLSVNGQTVSFMLQRGSFATVIMREIMKPRDPLASGF